MDAEKTEQPVVCSCECGRRFIREGSIQTHCRVCDADGAAAARYHDAQIERGKRSVQRVGRLLREHEAVTAAVWEYYHALERADGAQKPFKLE